MTDLGVMADVFLYNASTVPVCVLPPKTKVVCSVVNVILHILSPPNLAKS